MEELQYIRDQDTERRSNGSQVHTEPYSETAINRLKHLVITFYNQGERKFYAIAVDGETVVPKNCDGRKFDRYLQFVNPQTKLVEVKMYQGTSPNCNKYQFVMNQPLSGIQNSKVDVDTEIKKALAEQEMKNELEWLRSEVEKKNKKIKKLKKIIENSGINMQAVTNFVKESKPLLGALGLGMGTGMAGIPQPPETEVEIEPEEQDGEDFSEEQEIYHQLVDNVGKKGIKKALRVMTILSQHPELESSLEELLNQKNSKNEQA